MYDFIKGNVAYSVSNSKGFFVTLEVAGIGYLLELMERDFYNIPSVGQELKSYVVLIHKEDKMGLCGFLKREDRDIFNILTSVSGVGQKMAMTLINSFEISALIGLVLDGDYKTLTKAKGVGPKLAQKIILELKDKLTNYNQSSPTKSSGTMTLVTNNQNVVDAQQVLYSFGYSKDEVASALTKVLPSIGENAQAEDILKETLRILSI